MIPIEKNNSKKFQTGWNDEKWKSCEFINPYKRIDDLEKFFCKWEKHKSSNTSPSHCITIFCHERNFSLQIFYSMKKFSKKSFSTKLRFYSSRKSIWLLGVVLRIVSSNEFFHVECRRAMGSFLHVCWENSRLEWILCRVPPRFFVQGNLFSSTEQLSGQQGWVWSRRRVEFQIESKNASSLPRKLKNWKQLVENIQSFIEKFCKSKNYKKFIYKRKNFYEKKSNFQT